MRDDFSTIGRFPFSVILGYGSGKCCNNSLIIAKLLLLLPIVRITTFNIDVVSVTCFNIFLRNVKFNSTGLINKILQILFANCGVIVILGSSLVNTIAFSSGVNLEESNIKEAKDSV